MNLRSIDLNLLVILDALLKERHVTRAANRLNLSQPATSNALDRCRYLFKDKLLERSGGEMVLTPKAVSLIDPIAAILNSVTEVVSLTPPDLEHISQTIKIVCADQPAIDIFCHLLEKLKHTAPNLDLVLLPWHGTSQALRSIESGDADIAISIFPSLASCFKKIDIAPQDYVVAMRKGHPATDNFDLNKWLIWPHIVVSGSASKAGSLDNLLAPMGLKRRVGVVVPSFMMVEPLLRISNLIGMMPASSLREPENLDIYKPPIKVPGFNLHMAWHTRKDNDLAIQHVVSVIKSIY